MQGLLNELHSLYNQIINSQIGRLEPGLSSADFISKYKSAVEHQHKLHRKLDKLLKERLYPMLDNISSLPDKDEAELFDAVQRLSSYSNRLDPGLALKFYQKLLENARNQRDDAKIVKYLYWCGITHFFLTSTRKFIDMDRKTAAYFEEGSEYARRYDDFDDPDTRQYIIRCMGNKSMMYYHTLDAAAAYAAEEENFAFWNKLMFCGKDTDFPWLSYFTYCLNHRHRAILVEIGADINNASKAILQNLLELSIIISKLYNRDRNLYDAFGGARYDFLLWRAQFLSGLISFEHLCENVEKRVSEYEDDDYSTDAMFAKFDTRCTLIVFVTTMNLLKEKKDEYLPGMLSYMVNKLSTLPMSVDSTLVRDLLSRFAGTLGPILSPSEQIDIVLKLTAHRYIQLYAHSMITGRLSAFLTRKLIEKNPGDFTGCPGITAAEDAVSHVQELCDFAHTAGLCHDIGRSFNASNPFLMTRNLTDDEYELIKLHPRDGAMLLARNDGSELNKGYADVILGHHKYYDNSGGYPDDFDTGSSKVKIMIDIVSIADTIDDLTDGIGRHSSDVSSVEEVCSFIVSNAGKRFSPIVSSFFKDSAFVKEIKAILDTERIDAYYSAYLRAWDL